MPSTSDRWSEATAFLSDRDPALAAVIAGAGPCTLGRRRHPGGAFGAVARTILHQQLAGRAASAIHARFVDLYDGGPTAPAVLGTADEALRAAGLSAAKAASVKDLAARVVDGRLRFQALPRLDDEEVVARLCTVRGVGRWTAEMYLIFQLNRPDVWPVTDLGLRAGYGRMHGVGVPTPAELTNLGQAYRPYRTVAAWYCWRSLETNEGAAGRVSPPTAAW